MLIDLWEKFRGYDKWVETHASVSAATVQQSAVIVGSAKKTNQSQNALFINSAVRIQWNGPDGKTYSEKFEAAEESPLYQLCEGDTLTVRMNPRRPDEIYIPGLLESELMAGWKFILVVVVLVLAVSAYFLPEILGILGK